MSMNIKNKKITIFSALLVIILLASFLRFYKIDKVPPSLSWDEAAVGYNAYTIANWGKDEWGKTFPLFFKSFEDDKHPVHIYATALSVKFLGLSQFSTRLPAAVFGIFNVILIFFLAKTFFKSNVSGLSAAFFLAVSPYSIQFSRFNHELNFVLFFFMAGLLLFQLGLKKGSLLFLSSLSFGLALISYHPAKIIIPPILGLLIILNLNSFKKNIKNFLGAGVILGVFVGLILLNPELLGIARAGQTKISESEIRSTGLFQKTNNITLSMLEVAATHYSWHFTPQYLFISGDSNPKFSTQNSGMFYISDLLFLLVGAAALIIKNFKIALILLSWFLLAPIPSSLTSEAPHAARAAFMLGSWQITAAFGFYTIFKIVKIKILQILVTVLILGVTGFYLKNYLTYYFGEYPKRYAIEWQYGMEQIAEYVKVYNGYSRVFITDVRFQPYIFLLYYLKTPLPEFLSSREFNLEKSRSYNLISSFEKYQFGGWNEVESYPHPGVLYVVEPSKYSGLRYKDMLSVKKLVKYPNETDAFYLVSYP